MKPVSPVLPNDGVDHSLEEVKIAERQPQYQALPSLCFTVTGVGDVAAKGIEAADVKVSPTGGIVLSRWEFSDDEIETLLKTKSLYIMQ